MSKQSMPQEQAADSSKERWSREAILKAEIIKPLLELKFISTDVMREARKDAASQLGKTSISAATIYNWIRNFKATGLHGLEHKRHRDKGESSLHPSIRQYIIDLLQTKDVTLAQIHRNAEARARELELDETRMPSYDQILFVSRQLSQAAKLYGAKGSRAYRKTHELTVRFEADYPNHIWQCDHHLLDILLLNPVTGKAERPWITAIIDDYSRTILGFHLSFDHGNSFHIALALFHAMTKKGDERWVMHGIPDIFYVDNGKDFKSRHIDAVCLHFRIDRRSHEPYIARSKGKIERWFRTLKEMLLQGLDGYIGGSPKERPEKVTPKLTIEELHHKINSFILDTYHERIHSEIKEKPRVRWQTNQKPVRFVENESDLDHLLEDKIVTVQNDGIKFRGQYYSDVEGKLGSQIRKPVHIFFSRNDLSWIRVWVRDQDGERFLCVAITGVDAQTRVAQNKTTREHLANERNASQKRLQEMEKGAALKNAVPPVEPKPKSRQHPKEDIPPKQPRAPRYLFELEESDDDE